jgi:hypothetical protein
MSAETRFKLVRSVTWSLSTLALIAGLVFIRDPNSSQASQVYAALLIEAGGAFFFALTVGWTLDKLRDAEGYSVLWLFSQEFRKAGVLSFHSDRKDYAERALEQAFKNHDGGEVLMAGASLRLFLAPGLHFYSWIQDMLSKKRGSSVVVRALSCSPEYNNELPVRSFVEEFNQDRSFPKDASFDWKRRIDLSFDEFEKDFFENHGIKAPSQQRVRVISDLESTRAGVKALQGVAKGAGNHLYHREYRFAPYCTVIIFPDRAFYTPNLLCTEVPVNMPMIVFHRSSDVYEKLVNYVEFLWWVSDSEGGRKDV